MPVFPPAAAAAAPLIDRDAFEKTRGVFDRKKTATVLVSLYLRHTCQYH